MNISKIFMRTRPWFPDIQNPSDFSSNPRRLLEDVNHLREADLAVAVYVNGCRDAYNGRFESRHDLEYENDIG
jgi:hypothetical protein